MADDLTRYLEGRPVVARPVGAISRAVRWCRRNKEVAALLGLLFVSLSTGASVSTKFAVEAVRQADAEGKARRRADHTAVLYRLSECETRRALVSEQRASDIARAEKQNAEQQQFRAEQLLYAAQLRAAQLELQTHNTEEAQAILDACRWDLRGWEHEYLTAVLADEQLSGEASGRGGVRRLVHEEGMVRQIALSPDSQRLVVAGGLGPGPKQIRVLRASTGKVLLTMEGHRGTVVSVAFSPDGHRIVSSAVNPTSRKILVDTSVDTSPEVKVWHADTGVELLELRDYNGLVGQACWSPNGNSVVAAGGTIGKGEFIVWEIPPGKKATFVIRHGSSSAALSLAFSPDGTQLVSGGLDKVVRFWDLKTGRQVRSLSGHTTAIHCVAIGPDVNRIASGSLDKTVKLWDANSGELLTTFSGHTFFVRSVAINPNGTQIASCGRLEDMTIRFWPINTTVAAKD